MCLPFFDFICDQTSLFMINSREILLPLWKVYENFCWANVDRKISKISQFSVASMKSYELALAVEDETVIRKERSGYNSLEFSSRPTYPWRARTGRVRSRIQSRRSAGVFRGFPSSFRFAFAGYVARLVQSVGRSGPRFSRAIAIAPRLASRIDDEIRRYPAAVDNSRLRWSFIFYRDVCDLQTIRAGLDKRSAFRREFRCIECRLFVLPRLFNESGISSILSPAMWRTVRNRIRTRCCILMVVPIVWPYSLVDESFEIVWEIAAAIIPIPSFQNVWLLYLADNIFPRVFSNRRDFSRRESISRISWTAREIS